MKSSTSRIGSTEPRHGLAVLDPDAAGLVDEEPERPAAPLRAATPPRRARSRRARARARAPGAYARRWTLLPIPGIGPQKTKSGRRGPLSEPGFPGSENVAVSVTDRCAGSRTTGPSGRPLAGTPRAPFAVTASRGGSRSASSHSRFPAGPSIGDSACPSTSNPSSRAAAAIPSSAARRFASSRTTPPFPTSPLPDLELRLHEQHRLAARAQDRLHGREDEPERDEGQVADDEVDRSPSASAVSAGRSRARAPPRAGRRAASGGAGRTRRRPRTPWRRRAGAGGR